MTEKLNTLWALLGQTAEPDKITHSNVPEGEYSIDFIFPSTDQVTIIFKPYFTTVSGMKSIDPQLIPDDPEQVICTAIVIKNIYEYDKSGNEKPIEGTLEITNAFKQFIIDCNWLKIDLYDIK